MKISKSSIFSRESVDGATGTIRLLKVRTGSLINDHICCDLTVTNLDEHPVYYALSYIWGSRSAPLPVYVNGQEHYIRANLWSFLKHAQEVCSSEYLWIDAMCINQENLVERSDQVQLMSRIYSGAKKTIV